MNLTIAKQKRAALLNRAAQHEDNDDATPPLLEPAQTAKAALCHCGKPLRHMGRCQKIGEVSKLKPVTTKKLSPKPPTQMMSASVFPAEFQIHVERPGYLFHLETTVEEVYLAARESVQRRLEQV